MVEGNAADQHIVDALPPQRILDQSRLSIGAIQDTDLHVGIRIEKLTHRSRYVMGFVPATLGAIQRNWIAFAAIRPEPLSLSLFVVRDHCTGRVQDGPCRAIVLLKADHLGGWKIALEPQDIADVGTPPRIDRLIFVSDDAHIAERFSQQQHKLVLRTVRVLVLVHHHVSVALANRVADGFARLQQTDRF